jgi:hypothetical protein
VDNYRKVINGDIDNAWVRVRRITVNSRDWGVSLDRQHSLTKAIEELGTIEAWLRRDDDTGIHPGRARELLNKVQDQLDAADRHIEDIVFRAGQPNPF